MNTPAATALIADDEDAPRSQLRQTLQRVWPGVTLVAECANGADAWDAFLEHEPAVCFLDVRMPGLSGLDVAQRIGTRAQVVFTTAYGDHALAAFDAGAIDYVLKPVDAVRLAQAVARVQARLLGPGAGDSGDAAGTAARLSQLLDQLQQQVQPGRARAAPLEVIQAGVGKEVRLVRVDDVVYFESDARYTRVVYVSDGVAGEVLIRTPLKELLTQLDAARFWQVHRSVIVNQRHIASALRIDENSMLLTLRGRSETLPVSRHFQALFRGQ